MPASAGMTGGNGPTGDRGNGEPRVNAMPPLAAIVARFRPSGLRQVRLCSGLVLFCYICLHLTNHALGNLSLPIMERGLLVQKFIWQGWIGTTALYLALTVHFLLGLYALYERRRLHWTPAELTQLLLGLAVPPLLANHLAATRIAFSAFDLNKGYAQMLYTFWIASPALGAIQLTLLSVAWLHGCMGIAYWMRLQPWFVRWRAPLLVVAVLLPVLALLGYLQAGRAVMTLAQDPAWLAETTASSHFGTPRQNLWLASLRNDFLLFDGVALLLVVAARLTRGIVEQRRGRVCVSYPDGRRQHVPLGFSVMEASLLAGIPHAGLCGGRARCSLCRVRVLGAPALPPPDEPERRVLARLQADATHVRLACSFVRHTTSRYCRWCRRMRRQRSCIAVSNAPCRVSISLRSCSWTCAVRRNSLRHGCHTTTCSSSVVSSRRYRRPW